MTKQIILAALCSSLTCTNAQSLDLNANKGKPFQSAVKGNYLNLTFYNDQYLIAGSSQEVTVFELATQKIKSRIDFPGKEDKVWLNPNGKTALVTTQNYIRGTKTSASVDGFHYHDFASGKTTLGKLPEGDLIHEASFFHESNNLLLIRGSQKAGQKNSRVALTIYDPGSKKEREIYGTERVDNNSKIPIHALVSNDDSKIYCYVNRDGIHARFMVFDVKTGKQIFSKDIDYAFYFFETNEHLVITGSIDAAPEGITTLHNKTTFEEVKRIDKLELTNVLPNKEQGITYDWRNKRLIKVDLNTGKRTTLPEMSPELYLTTLAFSQSGNLTAISVKNAYSKTPQANRIGAYVFGSGKVASTPEVKTNPQNNWETFKSSNPGFSIDFPKKPTKEEKLNSKGRKVLKLKTTHDGVGYTLIASELSSKIKADKYDDMSSRTAENFIEKGGYTVVKKSTWSQGKHQGYQYKLKKKTLLYDYISTTANGYVFQVILIYKSDNKIAKDRFLNNFEIQDLMAKPTDSWVSYKSPNHAYSVKLPAKPEVTNKVDDKGRKSSTIKSKDNGETYLILSKQLGSKIQTSQYPDISLNTANSFAKKTGGKQSNKQVNGAEVSYTIHKGSLVYLYKCITVNGNTHQLIYIWKPGFDQTKTDRFFNSFNTNTRSRR